MKSKESIKWVADERLKVFAAILRTISSPHWQQAYGAKFSARPKLEAFLSGDQRQTLEDFTAIFAAAVVADPRLIVYVPEDWEWLLARFAEAPATVQALLAEFITVAEFISVLEASELMGITPSHVRLLITTNKLVGAKCSANTWLVDASIARRMAKA